jgi:hypothetical protein
MAAAALSALYFHRQLRECEGIDERASAQNRCHLSLLLLFTAFIIRLVTWPLLYILLQSLIPMVPGAMCIYGVTRVMPALISFLQVIKPLAFFFIGGWLLFYGLDVSLKNRPLINKSIRLLIIVSIVAAADGIAEVLFVLLFSPPGVAVSCCTVVADLIIPARPLIPVPLLSAHYYNALMAGYHVFNLGFAGFIGLLIYRKSTRRVWLMLAAIAALLNGLITYGAFKEYLGPRLMHLPDHHCLYCMLQYRPISIGILSLFVLGSFLAIWPQWLSRAAGSNEATGGLTSMNLSLFKGTVICLLASWLITVTLA